MCEILCGVAGDGVATDKLGKRDSLGLPLHANDQATSPSSPNSECYVFALLRPEHTSKH